MATSSSNLKIFVTVGSTKFTDLIIAILSTPVLDAVSQAAHLRSQEPSIKIQFGTTPIQDILFNEKLGLQENGNVDGGTLPIRLLSNARTETSLSPSEVAAGLSPEVIRDQTTLGMESSDAQQLGLKHFSVDWKASHENVHLEFIDYVTSITKDLEEADLVISHAGE
jgi:UDP-N-acetylglucosamine transferase subunit ALG13